MFAICASDEPCHHRYILNQYWNFGSEKRGEVLLCVSYAYIINDDVEKHKGLDKSLLK